MIDWKLRKRLRSLAAARKSKRLDLSAVYIGNRNEPCTKIKNPLVTANGSGFRCEEASTTLRCARIYYLCCIHDSKESTFDSNCVLFGSSILFAFIRRIISICFVLSTVFLISIRSHNIQQFISISIATINRNRHARFRYMVDIEIIWT